MPGREGVCRVKNPDGIEDDDVVTDEDGGNELTVPESVYRAREYRPPFDGLPWRDED